MFPSSVRLPSGTIRKGAKASGSESSLHRNLIRQNVDPSTLGQILRYWGAGKSSSTATSLSIAWWTCHGFNSHWFWELIDLEACEHDSHKILFQTQFSDHRMVFVRREQDVQLLSKSRADYRCSQADTYPIWHYTTYHIFVHSFRQTRRSAINYRNCMELYFLHECFLHDLPELLSFLCGKAR